MRFAIIYIVASMLFSLQAATQVGHMAPLGSVKLAKVSVGNTDSVARSSLPVCTPQQYACSTPQSLIYTFIGAGNWNDPDNWLNNLIPPSKLVGDFQIIIAPRGSAECILNVPQTIAAGGVLTLLPGKKFRVTNFVITP